MPHSRHVYHIYVDPHGRAAQAWQEALTARGIQTGIHYPIPVHLLPAYRRPGLSAGEFPHAERAAARGAVAADVPRADAAQGDEVARAVTALAAAPANAAAVAA